MWVVKLVINLVLKYVDVVCGKLYVCVCFWYDIYFDCCCCGIFVYGIFIVVIFMLCGLVFEVDNS